MDHLFEQLKIFGLYVLRISIVQVIPIDFCVVWVNSFASKPRRFPWLQCQVLRIFNQNGQFIFVRYKLIVGFFCEYKVIDIYEGTFNNYCLYRKYRQ